MNIRFKSKKLQKEFNDDRLLQRAHGKKRAGLIRARMDDFLAADNLEDLSPLPPSRCHPLSGKLKGKFAVDLDHPYRLIFEPLHNPLPLKPDGGIDLSQITNITIIEVKDYHGR